MKTCTQCLESKDESLFARSSQARDGLHTWCRLCKANAARVWWGKNSDRENEKDRRQYAADGTRQRSNALTWHRTNRPRSLENKRAWKLAQHPRLIGAVADIAGPDLFIMASRFWIKDPGPQIRKLASGPRLFRAEAAHDHHRPDRAE